MSAPSSGRVFGQTLPSPSASRSVFAAMIATNRLRPRMPQAERLPASFADEIAGYAKRTLVVSGILDELYPEVLAAFASRGFREISHKAVGEWTTGCLRRA